MAIVICPMCGDAIVSMIGYLHCLGCGRDYPIPEEASDIPEQSEQTEEADDVLQ